jgi:hypothetical protein
MRDRDLHSGNVMVTGFEDFKTAPDKFKATVIDFGEVRCTFYRLNYEILPVTMTVMVR